MLKQNYFNSTRSSTSADKESQFTDSDLALLGMHFSACKALRGKFYAFFLLMENFNKFSMSRLITTSFLVIVLAGLIFIVTSV